MQLSSPFCLPRDRPLSSFWGTGSKANHVGRILISTRHTFLQPSALPGGRMSVSPTVPAGCRIRSGLQHPNEPGVGTGRNGLSVVEWASKDRESCSIPSCLHHIHSFIHSLIDSHSSLRPFPCCTWRFSATQSQILSSAWHSCGWPRYCCSPAPHMQSRSWPLIVGSDANETLELVRLKKKRKDPAHRCARV